MLLGLGAMLTRPGTTSASPYELAIIALSLGFIAALVVLFFYGHRVAQALHRLLSGRSQRRKRSKTPARRSANMRAIPRA